MPGDQRGQLSVSSTKDWLELLGLRQYAEAFTQADIDDEVLRELSDDDLKSLGVTLGHRKKILKAIRELRGKTGPATSDKLQKVTDTSSENIKEGGREAERRQVSLVFCDLVGSTALSTRLDPEDLRPVMHAYYRCCANIVEKFGGSVANYQGDGVLIRFGYPRAHEDDAERAIRCGLEVVGAVRKLTSYPDIQLQARVGIATGAVVVGENVPGTVEQAITGDAPNLAARLQLLAQPGQVVTDTLTSQLASGSFSYIDLGRHELKGFADPVAVWCIASPKADQSRFAARHAGQLFEMVGRQHELGLLLHRWREAESGEGRVVILSGEAGIGKSRLVTALIEQLPADTHKPIWQCSSYHPNTALFPALDQLSRAAGFAGSDSATEKLDKLEKLVGSDDS
ncbi:MAG: AAA family ATPase, partial [Acetobacteraceae bacterium]|nr:AAA family ATPase [Acetobacteraceae bacterium]